MTDVEDTYADALARAIVADLERRPPRGALARVIIRWFDGPLSLTVHALGADDEHSIDPADACEPLE